MKKLGVIIGLMLASSLLCAHEYAAAVDRAAWFVEPSRLSCRLRQEVPQYGQAVFETLSGQSQRFSLRALRKVPEADVVVMESVTPEWRYPSQLRAIATVQGKAGVEPLSVDDSLASLLLDHLQEGFAPVFTHMGWQHLHDVKVRVSPVNFQEAYGAYLDCLTQLFPFGFESVVRSSVLFEVDKAEVNSAYRERLKLIADYMAVDPAVTAVYIDGHTDITGRSGYNWDLSRRRAEAIRDQLLEMGIAKDQVVLRYHGERLPVAANFPTSKRALNRRVTLRLERDSL